ncbi:MAG: metallophosphoesterase [Candidatus Alcyoniella australis]|nr:metallophosphoesterase [Candidatus Alcyoniella australis]
MSVRVLHTADLHLGASMVQFGEFADQRRDDFAATFERIVDRAIEGQADILAIAGDLFDRNAAPQRVIERVRRGCERLEAAGVVCVLVPGTHDGVDASDAIYRTINLPGAIVLMDPRCESPVPLTVRDQRINLYGLAARPGTENPLSSMARRDLPGLHLGLLHATLVRAPQWQVPTRDVPVTAEQLADLGLDYVALGHLHRQQTVEHEGRLVAAYCGSPEGKDFTENGPRAFLWVELSAGGARIQSENCQTRQLAAVEVEQSDVESLDQAVDAAVTACGEASICRVTLRGSPPLELDLAGLRQRLEARLDYLELIDDTLSISTRELERLGAERTVRGAFVQRMAQRLESAADDQQRELLTLATRLALVEFKRGDQT